jgi:hypothetical protein
MLGLLYSEAKPGTEVAVGNFLLLYLDLALTPRSRLTHNGSDNSLYPTVK